MCGEQAEVTATDPYTCFDTHRHDTGAQALRPPAWRAPQSPRFWRGGWSGTRWGPRLVACTPRGTSWGVAWATVEIVHVQKNARGMGEHSSACRGTSAAYARNQGQVKSVTVANDFGSGPPFRVPLCNFPRSQHPFTRAASRLHAPPNCCLR